MASQFADAGHSWTGAEELWSPGPRTRFWLPLGIRALLGDLVLGVVATALELAHWGKEGLTPDVIVSYVALLPQTLIVATYLILARDAGARSIYKSMAGLYVTYLLFSLLSLVLIEVLPDGWNVAVMLGVAFGIVGLLIFSFSKRPTFVQETSRADEAAAPDNDESSGSGCWLHLAIVVALFLARRIGKANNWLPNLAQDDWAIVELLVLIPFGLIFAAWFAMAKIRHSDKLGAGAVAVAGAELLILFIHAALLAVLIYVVLSATAVNPQIDEDDLDKLMDVWLKRGTVVSVVCQGVWSLFTAFFFASLWMRPERDWRQAFINPGSLA